MNTDKLHTPDAYKNWNESFYFNWYDKKQNICCFTRIGLTPNKDEKNMFLFFMLPNGKKLGIRENTPLKTLTEKDKLVLTVNDLQFIKKTNEKEWQLIYDGKAFDSYQPKDPAVQLQFNLHFTGLHSIFNYRDCPISALQKKHSKDVASDHLEQYGKITGSLTVEDNTYEINALGERDHS